jgi:hypothetical protein
VDEAYAPAVSKEPKLPAPDIEPLDIEQLEAGLRILNTVEVNLNAFWDENIASFRQTVLLSIRDTTDALLSPTITLYWRARFEHELEALIRYLELADLYIARRGLKFGRQLEQYRRWRSH